MIVDSSALVAVLHGEPESLAFLEVINDNSCSMSAATFLEAAIVIDSKRDPLASRRLDDFCNSAEIRITAVDERQACIAREAYRDFGKGSGHPAKLNFGDCFAYALAKATGDSLLFKGDDFAQTDVRPALPR